MGHKNETSSIALMLHARFGQVQSRQQLMKPLIWDLGILNPLDERQYIGEMLEAMFHH